MTANREFAGRRALVTGGTKGIGQAVAAKLREAGATVLITARTRGGAGLDDHHFVAADVTTAAGCASVADAARDRLGGIDIIIHVVGGLPLRRAALRSTQLNWLEHLPLPSEPRE
jgi:NAD(P)-dependent dehydrogenase (short-subunit alcohol dehydrogenase family)